MTAGHELGGLLVEPPLCIQQTNDVQSITRAANALAVTLPAEVTKAVAHLDEIRSTQPAKVQVGKLAASLAEHVGNPAAMSKAIDAATQELALAEAQAKLYTYLPEQCGVQVHRIMRRNSAAVLTAFADALAPDFATLNETAALLPEWFRPEHAGDLSAAQFADWSRARDAWDRVAGVLSAVSSLYPRLTDVTQFPPPARLALRVCNPGNLTTSAQAYDFLNALMGRAGRTQGLASQGSVWVDGIFVPTAIAHAGGTFEMALPDEVQVRADYLLASAVSLAPGTSVLV